MRSRSIAAVAGIVALGSVAVADETVVDLIVSLESSATPADITFVQLLGGEVRYAYTIVDAMAVRIPADKVDMLATLPTATLIEEDSIGEWLGDGELDAAWAVKQVNAGDVHAMGITGEGVKLGIMDSGIHPNHEDLIDNYVFGYDFENNDNNPDEPFGHGTYVSGCAAAVDNGFGVVGMAPGADIYMLKVGGFGPQTSAIIAALEFAVDNELDVTNSSFGINVNQAATNAYNAANEAGILNVAAAGNCGCPFVSYPGNLDSVMAVSATAMNKSSAGFTSYGNEVEVAAPGQDIYTTASNGGYGFNSGTSFSSPYVVGLAALLFEAGPADENNDGNINDEIRQIIKDTAEDLGPPGWDNKYGYGLIDALAAVKSVETGCYPDFDGDGLLTILDFVAYQNAFTAGDLQADCDGDGDLTILDFVCFQNAFTAGCE